ncbi:MAG TPA: rod shape-determining protein MreC [Sphingomonas sp.]|jgi:rod shape-determining protein MreC|uniref:rod shape-determining protein MreC n=1 Tax=Sphingomonas sp. TaxID=28214 RepID=UPI002EDA6D9C
MAGRDRRPGFSRRRQYGVLLSYVVAVAGVGVGAVLLLLSTLNPPLFSALRMSVAEVTTPIASLMSGGGQAMLSVPRAISTYFAVHDENERLRREAAATRRLLTRARAIAHDNRRLRTLLALRDRSTAAVVSARLVGSTAGSTRRFALLNAGRVAGVRPGMPVRGPDGLVGRVVETGLNAARVLLLVDPDSVVPVRRTRDGLPAIVAGRGDGAVDIRSVDDLGVRFAAGDLFVTSGTGGIYPPGIPVARVVATGRDTVLGRTVARADTLDFALVERPFLPLPPPSPALPPAPPPSKPGPAG